MPSVRDLTLAELDIELSRSPEAPAPGHDVEALVVLLVPPGSPFEVYAAAMAPGIAASHGRLVMARIDTDKEPHAPARFGLSGAPGLVLFVGGKQVAAFAVPTGGLGGMGGFDKGPWGRIASGILTSIGRMPAPPPPRGSVAPRRTLEIEGSIVEGEPT